jgi:hypothetical protein
MKKLLIVSTLLIGLVQCKKDSASTTPEFNTANVAGIYKITAVTGSAASVLGGADLDIMSLFFRPCELDDNYVFNATGSLSNPDIASICTPPSTPKTGPYSITTTPENQITFGGRTYKVYSYTALNMVIGYTETNFTYPPVVTTPTTATIKLTLTRQ